MLAKNVIKALFLCIFIAQPLSADPVQLRDHSSEVLASSTLSVEIGRALHLTQRGRRQIDIILRIPGMWPFWPAREVRVPYALVDLWSPVETEVLHDGQIRVRSPGPVEYIDGVFTARRIGTSVRLMKSADLLMESTTAGGVLPVGQRPMRVKAGEVYDVIDAKWRVLVTQELTEELQPLRYTVWLVERTEYQPGAFRYAEVEVGVGDLAPAEVTLVVGKNGVLSVGAHRTQGFRDEITVEYPQGVMAV